MRASTSPRSRPDQDPRQVPAGAGERRVEPAARAHVREELPAHLRRGAGARRQGAGGGIPALLGAPERRRPASRSSAAANGVAARAPPGALAGLTRASWCSAVIVAGDRAAGRRAAIGGRARNRPAPPTTSTDSAAKHHTRRRAAAQPADPAPARRRAVAAADRGRVRVPARRRRPQADPGPGAASPAQNTPTYHARRFEVTLGNSAVTMVIDGSPRTVPPSSEAIGYSITKTRGRQALPAGSMPTCK